MFRGNSSEFHKPHLLAVEGDDDFYFLIEVLRTLNIETIQIHCLEGVGGLGTKLKTMKKTPGFGDVSRLAVLVDSDDDPAGRQQSIRTALTSASLPVPPSYDVFAGNPMQVKYSTIPGPNIQGCLEDLLIKSLAHEVNAACVDSYLNCTHIQAVPGSSKWAKAWVHSFLSTRPNPGLKIGEATKAGYIDVSHVSFDSVRQFVTTFTS